MFQEKISTVHELIRHATMRRNFWAYREDQVRPIWPTVCSKWATLDIETESAPRVLSRKPKTNHWNEEVCYCLSHQFHCVLLHKTSIFDFCFNEGTLLTKLTPKEQILSKASLKRRFGFAYHNYEGFEATYNNESSPNLTYSGSSWIILGCLGRFSVCRKFFKKFEIQKIILT